MTYDEKVSKIPTLQELLSRAQSKAANASTTGMTTAAYPETQEVDSVVAADMANGAFLYLAKMKDILGAILAE